jgi:hypothetical protein
MKETCKQKQHQLFVFGESAEEVGSWKMSVHIVEATYLDQNNDTTVQQISN